jgi:hypothetical protein
MNDDNIALSIEVLEGVPVRKFDLGVWARFKHEHEPQDKISLHDRCGTAGCALGWIASDPRAMAQGLALKALPWGSVAVYFRDTWEGELAGAKFLGVSEAVADLLFLPHAYIYPEDIAAPARAGRVAEVRPRNVIERLELLALVGEKRFFGNDGRRHPAALLAHRMSEQTVCPFCGYNTTVGYGFTAGMSYAIEVATVASGEYSDAGVAAALADVIKRIQLALDTSARRVGT